MKITLIAAMDGKDGIGKNGTLPWHIPEDLKHFVNLTQFGFVVMGSKTWDSLPRKPLPFRANIVLSRDIWQTKFDDADRVFNDINELIKYCKQITSEIFIIGGASIYEQFLPRATHMVLTKTDLGIDYECDTFFPDFDESEWICTETKGLCDFVWVEYLERKQ